MSQPAPYIVRPCRRKANMYMYLPSRHTAIGKSREGFKGHKVFKMFIPTKPAKCELRIYVWGTYKTSFISRFIPYSQSQ
jgi:hypothetical protein